MSKANEEQRQAAREWRDDLCKKHAKDIPLTVEEWLPIIDESLACLLAQRDANTRLEVVRFIRDHHIDLGGYELVDKEEFDKYIADLEREAQT